MRLDYSNPESLVLAVEALIFATDEPLSALEIRSLILDEPAARSEAKPDESSEPMFSTGGEIAGEEPVKRKKANLLELSVIKDAVALLNSTYEQSGRTFHIVEIAGGYQFA